jgi:hypothetical protein
MPDTKSTVLILYFLCSLFVRSRSQGRLLPDELDKIKEQKKGHRNREKGTDCKSAPAINWISFRQLGEVK